MLKRPKFGTSKGHGTTLGGRVLLSQYPSSTISPSRMQSTSWTIVPLVPQVTEHWD